MIDGCLSYKTYMMRPTRRRYLTAGFGAIGTVLLVGCLDDSTEEWETGNTLAVEQATQYQGPNCDCCDVYASYLEDHLETSLDVQTVDDISEIKAEYGITDDLQSCHTLVLDDYIAEGHLPVESLEALLESDDDIDGISLPDMPSGSPGMAGEKDETWTIYGIDGSDTFVFQEL